MAASVFAFCADDHWPSTGFSGSTVQIGQNFRVADIELRLSERLDLRGWHRNPFGLSRIAQFRSLLNAFSIAVRFAKSSFLDGCVLLRFPRALQFQDFSNQRRSRRSYGFRFNLRRRFGFTTDRRFRWRFPGDGCCTAMSRHRCRIANETFSIPVNTSGIRAAYTRRQQTKLQAFRPGLCRPFRITDLFW